MHYLKMNRTMLRCTNTLSGSSLKEIARSRKMHLISTRKEIIMKLYNNKTEEDDIIWCDLANTINDLDAEKIITNGLQRYWKHHHHAKESIYEMPLEIYYSSQHLYTQDSWIDHA